MALPVIGDGIAFLRTILQLRLFQCFFKGNGFCIFGFLSSGIFIVPFEL